MGLTASRVPSPGSLCERLESRRQEIEQTILARAYAVSDPTGAEDPEYVAGLRASVTAAVSYGLSAVEGGDDPDTPIPSALFAQARHAARNGVSLDTVLRRYFAGYTLLGEFIMQEAEGDELLRGEELHRLSRAQAALFDRLVVAVTGEYRREADERTHSAEQARAERVRRLLAGELVDAAEVRYEFDGYHLGALAAGPGASKALRALAGELDRHLLLVHPGEGTIWAWFGGRRRVDAREVAQLASARWAAELTLAIGEAARGISGWRLTHRQALAALPIAQRGPQKLVRYADVALLASVMQDEVLSSSLNEMYLAPLAQERDGGAVLRETLRAYFDADRNVSSTAAALGVSRQTVSSRLRAIEARVGRPVEVCAAELETALRLLDLSGRQMV